MYYYFSATFPAVIKLNGVYFGTIENTVKAIDVKEGTTPFIEVCPVNNNAQNLNFLINDDFLSCPPQSVCVTNLKGGYLIKILCPAKSPLFKILSQEKFPHALLTVFNENGLKISIETETDFFAQEILFDADNALVQHFQAGHSSLFAVFLSGQNNLLKVFDVGGKIKEVFSRQVSTFNTENGLSTTENLFDMAKHVISVNWVYDNGVFKEESRNVGCGKKISIETLPEKLIPFAFLEEYFVGGNIKEYLSDDMLGLIDNLTGYLGNFIGIMPPPVFRLSNEVGLIYARSENLYCVEYFSFDVKDKKIHNLVKS